MTINYRGRNLDCGYRYDLVVDSRLPVELKAVEAILPVHQAQLLTYLRLGSHPLGLLINFDVPTLKDGVKRMALTRPPARATQAPADFGARLDPISTEILSGAMEVYQALGPGLLRSAYEECLCHELRSRKIPHVRQHTVPIQYEGKELSQSVQIPVVVNGNVPVICLSTASVTRLHEYHLHARLRQTGWPVGFLITFNAPVFQEGIRRIVL